MAFTYDPAMELPHELPSDPAWHEGSLLWWFDPQAGVGGFHWIAQYVGKGDAIAWCGVTTADGIRYRSQLRAPLRPQDRKGGIGVGPHFLRTDCGHPRIEVRESECEVTLDWTDLHTPVSMDDLLPAEIRQHLPGVRFEAAGRARGEVRVGDWRGQVDALGFRDRGWTSLPGWEFVTNHRWFMGTFGPALSFSAVAIHAADGTLFRNGYVVRDGQVSSADTVDIVVFMEADGITHRGGNATFALQGKELMVTGETMDGLLFSHPPDDIFWNLETVGYAAANDLKGGVFNLEMINNPRRGIAAPTLALRAGMTEGLSRR